MKYGRLTISGVIFLFSCIFYVEAGKFRQLKAIEQIGPDFWPHIVLLCLGVLSAVVFIMDLVKKEAGDDSIDLPDKEGRNRLVIGGAVILLYIALLAYVGFAVLTPFFMAGFMVILGERRKWFIALTAVLFTALVVVIFSGFFYIAIPRGMGIFRSVSLFFY